MNGCLRLCSLFAWFWVWLIIGAFSFFAIYGDALIVITLASCLLACVCFTCGACYEFGDVDTWWAFWLGLFICLFGFGCICLLRFWV